MAGLKMTVLIHTKHAQRFNRLLAQLNADSQVNLMQVTELSPATAVLLSEKVARGEFVAIAGDRIPVTPKPRVAMADFFGALAPFPVGPYILADLLQCPVFLLFTLRRGRTSEIHFELFRESIHLPRRERERALADLVAELCGFGSNTTAGARRCSGLTFINFGACRRWTQQMLRANEKPETRTIRFDMERVTIEDIVDIAAGSARAILSDAPEFRAAIARGADFLDRLLREDGTIYGVTTGFGDSCTVSIEPELVGELPRHLYTFHGCGLGEYLTAAQTRAVIATRLTSLCKGFSGVSFELLEQMVLLLRARFVADDSVRRLRRRQRRSDAAVLSRRGVVRRGRSLPRRRTMSGGGGAR